ncbi:MAG: holo-ACP synthase [Clostridia bacterium]|nr:holo-ACP synthase [Clostridia bacterium]
MISCGNDIIRISRVKDSIEQVGETFLKRVYTDEEINYCESRRMCKYQSYAARFAAKEAVYKAIAPETSEDVEWKTIEVKREKNGKPYIKLYGKIKELAESKKIESMDLSLSHDGDYAMATVVMCTRGRPLKVHVIT